MDKLRSSGSTFSTSGKSWLPFRHNPKLATRNAMLHRLMKAGKIQPPTKASLRAECEKILNTPPKA